MSTKPKELPAVEQYTPPSPVPEDPPLVNNANLPIWSTLAKTGDAINEARAIYKRLGYG